ncbi:hypothetical protein METBIDRAFT_104031 [Metschnikowia bicuspidata var. bicuspidata NRRL YB-4993]|uniref:Uncharacterized protein n=1 Tax=Metschnikowia bicuspidata var. bicuspidata NRRL YB-4993 TaxID=869754 RepID=A0A1A0HH41_9ASCO|nr:hypothetical protein METBIDRAFT_104031 [Metschnikowia bicuspidata var. bicuspidata NRRL YB-4993]OBA23316.1 hypothetical protein METBIDRAFT_104031 [Metschnikowia bicuspidata var. bicuspidata NRRL YB-4993]
MHTSSIAAKFSTSQKPRSSRQSTQRHTTKLPPLHISPCNLRLYICMSQYNRKQQAALPGNISVSQQQQAQQAQQAQQSQQSQINTHKRHIQQFYLHKLFDLLSDAEFLPLIPSDPVATAIQVQETMNSTMAMAPGYMNHAMQRPDQMAFYGQAVLKARRHSGQFLHQHLFGGKRNDYAQYKQGP